AGVLDTLLGLPEQGEVEQGERRHQRKEGPVGQNARKPPADQGNEAREERSERHAEEAERRVEAEDHAPLGGVDYLGEPRLLGRGGEAGNPRLGASEAEEEA